MACRRLVQRERVCADGKSAETGEAHGETHGNAAQNLTDSESTKANCLLICAIRLQGPAVKKANPATSHQEEGPCNSESPRCEGHDDPEDSHHKYSNDWVGRSDENQDDSRTEQLSSWSDGSNGPDQNQADNQEEWETSQQCCVRCRCSSCCEIGPCLVKV
mmetsp:Transcript_82967/g.152269  ORF Transcript_82967/g.152269 Transcript_82967/m.152269 type:complete len:161 (+) Transcript_82967:437-919(+)